MSVGNFIAGIGALIWSTVDDNYLLLKRSDDKDYAAGVWECVTGRVNQGESFEEALRREVREELGLTAQIEFIIGTTHFYRGKRKPENELLGVVYACSLDKPERLRLSAEHSEYRWVSAAEAERLLIATDPSTQWISRVIRRAEKMRQMLPATVRAAYREGGFELG